MFENLKNKIDYAKQEEEILSFWDEKDIFKKSLDHRKKEGKKHFSFYDGPPFATGLPHYGHILASYIKDTVARYKTMGGFYVPRRFGWDCHGLPIEMLIQEELSLNTPQDVRKYGEDKFNEACLNSVFRYEKEWEKTIARIGRWVDFKDNYKTLDRSFMESVWWVFKRLFEADRIYEGHRVLPYSWKAATSLSNFEANSNYKSVQDPAVTVSFRLLEEENAYFLAWTTTPWTLVSNLGLCVNENLVYVKAYSKEKRKNYYLSKERLSVYLKGADEVEILAELTGKELIGKRYAPFFNYMGKFLDLSKAHRVFSDDYVTNDSGTGVVHLAPYGEDDYRVLSQNGVKIYDITDENGCYIEDISEFKGVHVKEADKAIIQKLKNEGNLFHQETIQHNYPFCWRTDTPLIYKPISTWFVRVSAIREEMSSVNQNIHWTPQHLKDGRFGNWLKEAKDWDIGRNRFWGTPLPLWRSKEGKILCIGSIEELAKYSGKKVEDIVDIHKHHIDTIVLKKDGEEYERVSQVLDCWFESGSMPFAQSHYPFENKDFVEKNIPADFIAEGLDQTRGWFYTLLVISTFLRKDVPFKNVVVNGLVLAEDGRKMSKRLKNYPDPQHVLDAYGSDALRMYMISSPAVKGEYLRFSEEGVKNILKTLVIPLWNSLSFLTTYANIDGWDFEKDRVSLETLENPLDRWIISQLENQLVSQVVSAMDRYDLSKTLPFIANFVESLTNWYIRRSRRRFWKSENDDDKLQAYSTLYEALLTLSKVLAPFMPFLSEKIYLVLTKGKMKESVHLEDYPQYLRRDYRNEAFSHGMQLAKIVVELGLSLRSEEKIKVRQPLKELTVVTDKEEEIRHLKECASIILEELNVKNIRYETDVKKYLDVSVNPNFAVLRSKGYAPRMKEITEFLKNLDPKQIEALISNDGLPLDAQTVLTKNDVLILTKNKTNSPVKTYSHAQNLDSLDGSATTGKSLNIAVMLNTDLNEELVMEGYARDIVNAVQKTRKDMDLNYTDRIRLYFQANAKIKEIVSRHKGYILNETLSKDIIFVEAKYDKTGLIDSRDFFGESEKNNFEEMSLDGDFVIKYKADVCQVER